MTFVSWAAFHEGRSDAVYLDVLLPRLMEAIIIVDGIGHSDIPAVPAVVLGKNGREVDAVAAEICDAKDAFEIVFIHADAGGRHLEDRLANRSSSYCERAFERCGWLRKRCITVVPRLMKKENLRINFVHHFYFRRPSEARARFLGKHRHAHAPLFANTTVRLRTP